MLACQSEHVIYQSTESCSPLNLTQNTQPVTSWISATQSLEYIIWAVEKEKFVRLKQTTEDNLLPMMANKKITK